MEGRTTFPRVSGGIVLDSFSAVSFFTGLLAALPAGALHRRRFHTRVLPVKFGDDLCPFGGNGRRGLQALLSQFYNAIINHFSNLQS